MFPGHWDQCKDYHKLKPYLRWFVIFKQSSYCKQANIHKTELLQPHRWCWVKCVIYHELDVREEQHHTYMWREQAIIEWSWHVNSIVACFHSAKLCAHASRDFRSQQNGAVTRMWRSCQGQPSHKERAIGAVRCKKEGMLLQPLRWCWVKCVIRHERDVREEQHHTYMWREQAINRVIMACELYCCLLPQCEALRSCRSGQHLYVL